MSTKTTNRLSAAGREGRNLPVSSVTQFSSVQSSKSITKSHSAHTSHATTLRFHSLMQKRPFISIVVINNLISPSTHPSLHPHSTKRKRLVTLHILPKRALPTVPSFSAKKRKTYTYNDDSWRRKSSALPSMRQSPPGWYHARECRCHCRSSCHRRWCRW